jgi:hemerythrin-like domain-containing protein
MTKSHVSDPPPALVLIHRAISRGLDVGCQYAESFSRDGYPDLATGSGFALYLQTLAGILHQHHSAEDEIAFPFLRDKLPGLPFDDLIAEHEEMEEILGELALILDGLQGGAGDGPALDAVCAELSRLTEIWPGHIGIEETGVSTSKLVSIVGPEALGGWLAEMGQHRPVGAPPDPVGIPFVLFNLSEGDRAIMAEQMPPIVVQELVPGPWKEHWAPMRPFLLD